MEPLRKWDLESGLAVDGDGRTFAGMGADFSDYNNDGWPDLVVDDLANQKYAIFRNDKDGSFEYDSYAMGLAGMSLLHSGWGLRFMDYDNDGWKDLMIAQGHDLDTIEKDHPQLHYREPLMLLRNVDGKSFVNVGPASGPLFQQHWVGRGRKDRKRRRPQRDGGFCLNEKLDSNHRQPGIALIHPFKHRRDLVTQFNLAQNLLGQGLDQRGRKFGCVRPSVMPPAKLDGLEKICSSHTLAYKLAIDPRSYHGAIATMQHPAQPLVLRSDHFQVDGVTDDALHAGDFLRPEFG